jgi:K+-transporting ATPase ATPase A chain
MMSPAGILQIVLFLGVLLALTKPLGAYMARVYEGERTWLTPVLGPVERFCYRACGIDPAAEQDWKTYAVAMLLFSLAGFGLLYGLQRLQALLPFNPQAQPAVPPDLAFNTAVSFVTNTNWQSYAGETTMSYLVQMAGLTTQNFVSAATGMAIALAVTRGLARHESSTIGSFWVDLVRGTLYVLLPLSIALGLVLAWQGTPQNLNAYVGATSLEGPQQTVAQGPVASQEAIKLLGTNGGGFFNTNSAHPYENPTPFTNFLEMLALLAIPAGIVYTFGRLVGDTRQGWALWTAMAILLLAGIAVALPVEQAGNPLLTTLHVDQQPSALQAGGSLEGKETRFGIASSILFTVVTTDAGGAANAMLDSLMPLAGFVAMFNMLIGEIAFGGVGSGLYGMIVYAFLTVFLAGLMVGRTPDYLGKKLESFEIRMAMLAVLAFALPILGFTAAASVTPAGTSSILNPGPHGFSEILYAYTSASANNGTAFAGLAANTVFYNVTLGLTMLIGRFLVAVPVLALAGSLARKPRVAPTLGRVPTDGPLFVGVLVGTILIVGLLTYFPALAIGPLVEHLHLTAGRTFR